MRRQVIVMLYTWRHYHHQKNLQYIINKKKNAMIPTGPYCLHIAIKLICLACLRYLADSSLNELDNVDIPTISTPQEGTHDPVNLHDKLNPQYS
jgi:hypothetical protein